MEKNISKAKSAEATYLILRFINAHPEWSYIMEQLISCDADRLKALLKVKDMRLSEELISYIATTADDIYVISRVVTLINNYFKFCDDIKKYAQDQRKTELLLKSYKRVGNGAILDYCKPEMDAQQIEETIIGFEIGLNEKQIEYYSDYKKFTGAQMREIRKGFESAFKEKDIRFIAESGFSAPQMRQIRKARENGVSLSCVKKFAKIKYDEVMLEQIRKVMENSFSDERNGYVDFINASAFNVEQIKFIREAVESGVSLKEVKQLMKLPEDEAREKLNEIQKKRMGFIRKVIESGVSLKDAKDIIELPEDEAREKLNEILTKKLQEMCQN